MANCPNCGVHLKKTYWKPNCPNCNVNIFYNGMEERLEQDIIDAEISLNKMYNALDRVKASYIGSKLAIVRIILSVLPIGMLFLPLAKINVDIPMVKTSISANAITVYNAILSLDFGALFKLFGSQSLSGAAIMYFLAILLFVIGAVLLVANFIMLFMSCGPKGIQRNVGFGFAAFLGLCLGGLFFLFATSGFSKVFGADFSASLSWGYFLSILTALAPVVINLVIKKHPIVVKSSAEKRKKEIEEKAAQMAADLEAQAKKEAEQKMIEEAYAAEHQNDNK